MKRRKNAIYKGQSKRASTGSGNRALVDNFYSVLNHRLLPKDEIEIIPPEQVNPTQDLEDQTLIMANYCVRKILPEVTGMFDWGDKVTLRLRALAPMLSSKSPREAYEAAKAAEAAGPKPKRRPWSDNGASAARVAVSRAAARLTAVKAAYRDARTVVRDSAVAARAAVPRKITSFTAYAAYDVDEIVEVVYDVDEIVEAAARRDAAYDAAHYTEDRDIPYDADKAAAKAVSDVAQFAAKLVYRALRVCAVADDEATYNRIIDLTNEMLESL